MSRWFRFYSDAMRHPKVLGLSDREFRVWVSLLSIAAENDGEIPGEATLKKLLNARLDHLLAALKSLLSAGLIEPYGSGYVPHNWHKRQYKSDTSTERVKKHRRERNVSVTSPDTETDTETENTTLSAGEPDYDELSGQLLDAGGDALNPTAVSLHVLSDPLAWLRNGADLRLDILPVIRARAARAPRHSIRSWGFFTQAIAEARERRCSGLPAVEPQRPRAPWGPQPIDEARMQERLERRAQQMTRGAA